MATTRRTYSALLTRTDPKAGTTATLRVEVEAPNVNMAKKLAEARAPGYSAQCTPKPLPRK